METRHWRPICLFGCLLMLACQPVTEEEKRRLRVDGSGGGKGATQHAETGEKTRQDGQMTVYINGEKKDLRPGFSMLGPSCKPLKIQFGGEDASEMAMLEAKTPGGYMDATSFNCDVYWTDASVGVGTYREPFDPDKANTRCLYKPMNGNWYNTSDDELYDLQVVIESMSSTRLRARFQGSMDEGRIQFSGHFDGPRKDDTTEDDCG